MFKQRVNRRLSRVRVGAVAASLAVTTSAVYAADWSIDPKITLNAETDDNKRMSNVPGEEIDVAGAELDAQVSFRSETPRTSFELIPRVRSTFYPGDEEVETNNQFLRLGFEGRGQRSTAAFDADYSRRETLGRFFPETDVGDDDDLGEPDPGEDIGESTIQNRQELLRLQPAVDFELTERVGLGIDLGYLDVSYDEQVLNDREDFTSGYGRVGLSFGLSPTKELSVRAAASRFEPENEDTTNAQALDLQWSNRISEVSQVFVRGGASRAESNLPGSSQWNTGFTGGAGVRWGFEVTKMFLEATRELDPNSSGRLVERDQLRFQLSRKLSPVTTLVLGARGIRDSRTDEDATFQEREYAAASVRFEWRMTRQWALGGGYEYVWRSHDAVPNDAESNRLHVGITYEPNRR